MSNPTETKLNPTLYQRYETQLVDEHGMRVRTGGFRRNTNTRPAFESRAQRAVSRTYTHIEESAKLREI